MTVTEEAGGRKRVWFGIRAVAWVLDEAPDVPASLVSTLLGVARHADDEGRGSYPSVETLVAYTRKSRRQVKYDLAELVKRGLLIVSVDQSAAAALRADRRPTVYELPLGLTRKSGCSPLHPDAERRAADCTPSEPRGAIQRRTGCNTASNGVQPIAPEEELEDNQEKTRSTSLSANEKSWTPTAIVPTTPPERETDHEHSFRANVPASPGLDSCKVLAKEGPSSTGGVDLSSPLSFAHRMLIEHGVGPGQVAEYQEWIENECNVGSDGWWIKAAANGTLGARVVECGAALSGSAPVGRRRSQPSTADERLADGQRLLRQYAGKEYRPHLNPLPEEMDAAFDVEKLRQQVWRAS